RTPGSARPRHWHNQHEHRVPRARSLNPDRSVPEGTPMKSRYRVVIIGAGIMGLATAFHLAERGITDVLIVDRGYLCGGASGRNGGGVRAQFSSETNIRLMQ